MLLSDPAFAQMIILSHFKILEVTTSAQDC